MVKKIVLVTLLVVLSLSMSAFAGGGLVGKKIYVDPGNGGSDAGVVGIYGLKEKDVNLRVGIVLRDCLVNYGGAQVRMSRTTDVYFTISYRITDANSWGAHRFISIHHNGSTDPTINGTITQANSSVLEKNTFRDYVHAQLLAWGNLPNLGVQSTSSLYYNLSMPGIVTLASYISNPAEESRLRDTNYTWRQGYYIYKGVCDHFGVSY